MSKDPLLWYLINTIFAFREKMSPVHYLDLVNSLGQLVAQLNI